MKSINILWNITGMIGDFYDLHLPLLTFAHWFMALTKIKVLPARSLLILWDSWIASCN